jgi:hypothetical protein
MLTSARSAALVAAGAIGAFGASPALAGALQARKAPRPGTLTETRVTSSAVDRRFVSETYVRQYEPLPRSLGAPAACNWIGYLRFRDRRGPRRRSRADAILVDMPGLLGGASLAESLASSVIRKAARRHRHFELWAIDRRANCLEDARGLAAARRVHDYHVGLDYYYHGRAIARRRFAGYRTSSNTPYVSEFGLARTMKDEYAVIARGIPNPAMRKRKVFCGGHSLGGSLTGAFASWHFADGDEVPGRPDVDDAGYNQCAGFFGLDTAVTNNLGGGSKDVGLKGDALYQAETAGIRSGALPRFAGSLPVLNPEVFELAGVMGIAANQAPNGSKLLRELPHDGNADFLLRFLLSRDAAAFASGIPSPRSFRLTNEALLGTFADDNSEPIAALQASLGTYDGGPVTQKDFPLPGALPDLPLLGPTLSAALADTIVTPGGSNTRLMIPATANGPLYRWRSYDRVGARGAPRQVDTLGHSFTSAASEVTSMHQFAGALYDGATDAWEQYFPMRLLLDDGAFLTGGRSGDLSAVKYENGPNLRPYVEIIAGEGVATESTSAPIEHGVGPRRRVVVGGYNHLDVATAAYRQNGHRAEGSSDALVRFVLDVTARGR